MLFRSRDDLRLCGTKESALLGADALVIVTDWSAFKAPDFDVIKTLLKTPIIFDGRNLFDPHKMAEKGLGYYSVGRKKL